MLCSACNAMQCNPNAMRWDAMHACNKECACVRTQVRTHKCTHLRVHAVHCRHHVGMMVVAVASQFVELCQLAFRRHDTCPLSHHWQSFLFFVLDPFFLSFLPASLLPSLPPTPSLSFLYSPSSSSFSASPPLLPRFLLSFSSFLLLILVLLVHVAIRFAGQPWIGTLT